MRGSWWNITFAFTATLLMLPAASGMTSEDLTPSEWEMYTHVQEHVSLESFASVPDSMKTMLARVAINAARGTVDPSRVPAYCFEGDIPVDVLNYLNWAYYGGDASKFNEIQNRWSSTASPGTVNQQGGPAVLTWSIVPDGTLIPGDSEVIDTETELPMADANSNLIAFLNGIYGSQAVWLQLFQDVFDDWSAHTGITYVYEPNDDGAAFPDSGVSNGTPGLLGVRGDIRIAGIRIDGQTGGNILAYNFYPDAGDMVIDTSNSGFFGNTGSNSRRLRNVFAHEHGHGLGMPHTCPIDFTKLMEPTITTAFDGVQPDERLSGQRTYGDYNEVGNGNDNSANATDLGDVSDSSASQLAVSIDDNSDVDFFKFTVAADNDVTITMAPIGSTYFSATQNSTTGNCNANTTFNALTVANLNLELRDTDGVTVLATANSAAAGLPEVITRNMSAAGTYFVRVFQATSVDNVQGYDLIVEAELVGPPVPVTDFSADVTSGTSPLAVQFTDTSTENPTAWEWDFENDGTPDSTDQNPVHVYPAPGSYSVKLTATNGNGSSDTVKTDFVTVTSLETGIRTSGGTWVEVGGNISLTALPAGGTAYRWFKDELEIPGETGQVLTLDPVALDDAGIYYAEVTTAAKGIGNTPTVEISVFAAGALPLGAMALGILAGILAVVATRMVWTNRRAT